MFSSVKKSLVAAAKFLVQATKNSFVVPNFVAVTKPFFRVRLSALCLALNSYEKSDVSF